MPIFKCAIAEISIRQVDTLQGTIDICQVEANVPLTISGEAMKNTYILGYALEQRQHLELDIEPFSVIIIRCCDHFGCFVCGQSKQEEPNMQIKLLEQDTIINMTVPAVTFGVKAEYGFISFEKHQKVRIEGLRSLWDYFDEKEAVDRQQKEKQDS